MPALAAIALAAWLNVALRLRFHLTQRLEPDRAAWLLAFDIAELAVLLVPDRRAAKSVCLYVPRTGAAVGHRAAAALHPHARRLRGRLRHGAGVRALSAAVGQRRSAAIAADLHDGRLACRILLAIGFIGVYAWQITEESRQLSDALAATELVLAREQHLSQLDGLAAAAAHELGTPLSTISVIAKELERAIAPNAPHGDDVRLLREQATRCRDILAKLTELSAGGEPFDRMPLTALIEEVVAPHRNFGVAIDVGRARRSQQRAGRRAQSGDPLWARQSAGKRGRFRPRPGGGRRPVGRGVRCGHDQRRWTGLCAGNPGSNRGALRNQPPAPSRYRRRAGGSGARILHRQDLARALGRHAIVRKSGPCQSVAQSSGCAGAAAISSNH